MSASGDFMYAANPKINRDYPVPLLGAQIYRSIDRGKTWSLLNRFATVKGWLAIDVSDSGQHVVAVGRNDGLYFSHNFGLTWTKAVMLLGDMVYVKLSRDGQKCIALSATETDASPMKLSTDGCATWGALNAPRGIGGQWGFSGWTFAKLGASSDLSTIAVGYSGWELYISRDSGQSFAKISTVDPSRRGAYCCHPPWQQILVSESGNIMIGLTIRHNGYQGAPKDRLARVSMDAGATWHSLKDVLDFRYPNSWRSASDLNPLEDRGVFQSVCWSRDLQTIYLGESMNHEHGTWYKGESFIWYTNDYGRTWQIFTSRLENTNFRYLGDVACSADASLVAFQEIVRRWNHMGKADQVDNKLWMIGPAPMPPSAPPPPPAQPPPLPPQTPYFLRRPQYSRPGHVNGMTINVHGNAILSKLGRPHGWGNQQYAQLDGSALAEGYVTITPSRGAFAAIHSDGHLISWGGPMYGGTVGAKVLYHAPWTHGLQARVRYANFIGISSTCHAFAAVDSRGQIYQWGKGIRLGGPRSNIPWKWTGPNVQGNVPEGEGYSLPASNCDAFATLSREGRIRAWGYELRGGCDGGGPPSRHIVTNGITYICAPLGEGFSDIVSNRGGFAALSSDGSVVAWGTYHLTAKLFPHLKAAAENHQGDLRQVSATETGFVKLFPSEGSFVAL